MVIVSLAECCPEEAWPEAEALTQQELQVLDFRVVVMASQAADDPGRREELVSAAEAQGGVGALQIRRKPGAGLHRVELWVSDLVTGKTSVRKIEMGDAEASIVALRAVELFRASLLELHVTPEPEHPPPQPVQKLAGDVQKVKPEGPVGLRLGLGVLGGRGGAGVHGALDWALSWSSFRWLTVELQGVVTFAGQEIRSGSEASTFGAASVRAWVLLDILHRGIVRPFVGVGGGVLVAWSRGLSADAGITTHDRVVTGHLGGTAQLALALSRTVWLRLGTTVGVALPRIRILFADATVASFGMPVAEGWVAVEVRIP